MRTVAIIQVRMSSTRLPGKALADVCGKPMLWHVVSRVAAAKQLTDVVVATSDRSADDPIEAFCEEHRLTIFRGSEQDVLDRFMGAARHSHAETIVRVTADCPLMDPEVIDTGVKAFSDSNYDYLSNTISRTYPDGLDVEIFAHTALERAWREAQWQSEREHVTPYIWNHPALFRLGSFAYERDLSTKRWTVDEPADLEFVRTVYSRLGTSARMRDVLELLESDPHVADINSGFTINEGYERSVAEDRIVSQEKQ